MTSFAHFYTTIDNPTFTPSTITIKVIHCIHCKDKEGAVKIYRHDFGGD